MIEVLDPGVKAAQVLNKHIAVAGAGKQGPGISDAQVLGSLGHRAVPVGNCHRQELPLGIEQ